MYSHKVYRIQVFFYLKMNSVFSCEAEWLIMVISSMFLEPQSLNIKFFTLIIYLVNKSGSFT